MSQGSLFTSAGPEWVDDPRMVKPTQVDSWARWVQQSPELVLDYESDGLDTRRGARSFMVGCYAPDKGAKVLDLRLVPRGLEALRASLKARTGVTIGHNLKHELSHSWALGTDIGGTLWDNQAASFALDERRPSHAQDELVRTLLKRGTPACAALHAYMNATFGTLKRGHHENPNSLEVPYNAEDVTDAWDLYQLFKRDAERVGLTHVITTDSELCRPVTEMEQTGIRFDVEKTKALAAKLTEQRANAARSIAKFLGRPLNIASHQALFGLLYGEWRIPMHADLEKQGKLDDDVLAWMTTLPSITAEQRSCIEMVRDWREADKLVDTFLLPWLYEHSIDGILYPNLNLCVADTRRFTADNPNLQNIPARGELGKLIRALFIALFPDWECYSYDYSQVEYRVFADAAGEPRLVKGYRTDPKFDIHAEVAAILREVVEILRDDAKHVNFGILYGMGVDKLARKLRCSRERAKAIMDAYMARIPSAKALKRRLETEVKAKGCVTTKLGGRRHMLPDESYKALNTYCQMTSADVIRRALVRAYKGRLPKWGMRFQLQVHDELLFGMPGKREDHTEALRFISEAMETNPEFTLPLRVEGERFAPSWGKKELVTL